MIARLTPNLKNSEGLREELEEVGGVIWEKEGIAFLICPESTLRNLRNLKGDEILESWRTDDNVNISHKNFTMFHSTSVESLGLGSSEVPLVLGPCSIESRNQIFESAEFVAGLGLRFLRGGGFKPRTDPYAFQGLGLKGLEYMREACDKFNLKMITEVRDYTNVEEVYSLSDVVQVGAKAMFDYGVLNFLGERDKPVLLKRAFGATLDELLKMAEFISLRGNTSVLLCERGIRTFESASRFTLDLAGIQTLVEKTNRPIWVDPSHAMGARAGVPKLTMASLVAGANGLLVEMHPDPDNALSDSAQQITFNQAEKMVVTLRELSGVIGKLLV